MPFVFPRLSIDVVQFCIINLLVVTLQKKLSSGRHKVTLTENRTVGVIPTSRLWGAAGALHCFCPRALKTLVTPLQTGMVLSVYRPTRVGRRSDSTVRIDICLGRSLGLLQDAGDLSIDARRARWWSSSTSDLVMRSNKRRRLQG